MRKAVLLCTIMLMGMVAFAGEDNFTLPPNLVGTAEGERILQGRAKSRAEEEARRVAEEEAKKKASAEAARSKAHDAEAAQKAAAQAAQAAIDAIKKEAATQLGLENVEELPEGAIEELGYGDRMREVEEELEKRKGECSTARQKAMDAYNEYRAYEEAVKKEREQIASVNAEVESISEKIDELIRLYIRDAEYNESATHALTALAAMKQRIDQIKRESGLYDIYDVVQTCGTSPLSIAEMETYIENQDAVKELDQIMNTLNSLSPPKVAGDPVLLSTGQFFFDMADSEITFGINRFSVSRFFLSGTKSLGAFGKSWQSSFDSGLCFGNKESAQLEDMLKSIISEEENLLIQQSRLSDISLFEGEAALSVIKIKESQVYFESLKEDISHNLSEIQNHINADSHRQFPLQSLIGSISGIKTIEHVSEEGGRSIYIFDSVANRYVVAQSPNRSYIELVTNKGMLQYELHSEDGIVRIYDEWGQLLSVKDIYGSKITFNYDGASGRLKSVSHNDQCTLHISWNAEGFISDISNTQSGEITHYEYKDKLLQSVSSQKLGTVSFLYDTDGDLTRIEKTDGSYIEIQYGTSRGNTQKRALTVRNEEGGIESFIPSSDNSTIQYIDADGFCTEYTFDTRGNMIEERKSTGEILSWSYDSQNRLVQTTTPFGSYMLAYTESGKLATMYFPDGTTREWEYVSTSSGIKVCSYTDRDGVTTQYSYDELGFCTAIQRQGKTLSSFAPNEWGGIAYEKTGATENSYAYDKRYNLTETNYATYYYDSTNTVSRIESRDGEVWLMVSSPDAESTVITKPNGLTETIARNRRGDITEVVQADTINNMYIVNRYEYDRRHLVTKWSQGMGHTEDEAFGNCMERSSFSYSPAGRLTESISWNYGTAAENDAPGIMTVYAYNGNNEIVNERIFFVDYAREKISAETEYTYRYSHQNKSKVTAAYAGNTFLMETHTDENGNITLVQDGAGRKISYTYTAEGVPSAYRNIYGGTMRYVYNRIWNKISEVYSDYGLVNAYAYDDYGQLQYMTAPDNFTETFSYAESDGVKAVIQSNPNGEIMTLFDSHGIPIQETRTDRQGSVLATRRYLYDTQDRTASLYVNGRSEELTLDAWNNILGSDTDDAIRVYDADGNILYTKKITEQDSPLETFYSYTADGNLSCIQHSDGRVLNYFYLPTGQLWKCTDNEGVIWEGRYNERGLLEEEQGRLLPRKQYEYDISGNRTCTYTAGRITQKNEYTHDMRFLKQTDASENSILIEYDAYGNCVAEHDRFGNKKTSATGGSSNYRTVTDRNGNTRTIVYDRSDNSIKTVYSDSTSDYIRLNAQNRITEAVNAYSSHRFTYNENDTLVEAAAGAYSIRYEYDERGNKRLMTIGNSQIEYSYDAQDRLQRISSGAFGRNFTYDSHGRNIQVSDDSGAHIRKEFDYADRLTYCEQADARGIICFAEMNVYNDSGHIIKTIEKDNDDVYISYFEYDAQGHVISYETTDISRNLQVAKREFSEYSDSFSVGAVPYRIHKSLLSDEDLRDFFIKTGCNPSVSNQVWHEEYTFDANGNRTKKQTPVGTILYEYDKENRLVRSVCEEAGTDIIYGYDRNGNLISRKSLYKVQNLSYNFKNMLTEFSEIQLATGERLTETVTYDALGRNIKNTRSDGTTTESVYDGLSFKKILEVSHTDAVEPLRYRKITDGEYGEKQTLFVWAGDNLTFQYSTGGSGFSYCTDQRNSTRSVLDENGICIANRDYTVNGIPYDIPQKKEFLYCGKEYDTYTATYNYGQRRYTPSTATFLTEDPVQDGDNWYAYCNGDPVNFVDCEGLYIVEPNILQDMQSYGSNVLLGNHHKETTEFYGCLLNFFAGAINALNGTEIHLTTLNDNMLYFGALSGDLLAETICADNGLTVVQYSKRGFRTDRVQVDSISDVIHEAAASSEPTVITVRTLYSKEYPDTAYHWVGITGDTVLKNGKEYVCIKGTSRSDAKENVPTNRKGTWLVEGDNVYIPMDEVVEAKVVTKAR